jgi:hypothetical protein
MTRTRLLQEGKMRKVLCGAVLLCCVLTAVAVSADVGYFRTSKEPDGFGGIKWGTDVNSLKGMTYIRTDPYLGGIDIYRKSGDKTTYWGEGGVSFDTVEYGFKKGKFMNATLVTGGSIHWITLKDVMTGRYGEGFRTFRMLDETHGWYGGNAVVEITYNRLSAGVTYDVYSREIYR